MRIIKADGHDEDAWRGALAASSALRQVRDEGTARFDGFGDMLADIYHLMRQTTPRWAPAPQATLHQYLLGELTDLPEFRELRVLVDGDPDNAALAACILGRKLTYGLEALLTDLLQAESAAFSQLSDAEAQALAAEDLAVTLGDGNEVIADARAAAEAALARAAATISELPHPENAADMVAAFRREARTMARAATTTLASIAEAGHVIGGGSMGGLAAKLSLADKLAGSKKFTDLVAIAGRIKRVALEARAVTVKDVPPEVVGVTYGRDPQRALPGDLALLALPSTRMLFWKKLVEGQLLVQEQRGEERLGGGPIVICLDGSGSMAGPRELWAKGVALGYLAIAGRERRDVIVGQFGAAGQIEVQNFPYRTRPETVRQADILTAMDRFLDAGGTDLEGALRWAVKQIQTSPRLGSADIVVLTDAEAQLTGAFLTAWTQEQERLGFRSYGVLIGDTSSAGHLSTAIQHVVVLQDLSADGPALQALFGHR